MTDTGAHGDYIAPVFAPQNGALAEADREQLLLADNTRRGALNSEDSGPKRYDAAVAVSAELTTVVIPVFRQGGIDGLTVSVRKRLGSP
ncbi:MAG TPA: hypothetical protein VFK05_11825 [Polyangiaceae bacterium]|nr:hypothetical protein [Polyangiaceae bacterium]